MLRRHLLILLLESICELILVTKNILSHMFFNVMFIWPDNGINISNKK